MDSKKTSFTILMFPWLSHTHIFPYLELSNRLMREKNFNIHLCTTPINFTLIHQFLRTSNLSENSIQLLPLHLHPNPLLPPHYHTTKNLPSHLNLALLKAFQTAKSSFSDVITTLKPDLLVFDVFQPWAAESAMSLGIPAVHFYPLGAAAMSYIRHHYITHDDDFPFPELCVPGHEKKSADYLTQFLYVNVFDRKKDIMFVNYELSEVVLLNTTRAVEGKYIDYVSSVSGKRILPVGPLVVTDGDENEEGTSNILQWLSKKDENSTAYVSFGSEHFLSKEEIVEIAKGLQLCEVNFLWVLEFPPTEKRIRIEEALPEGFLETMEERGRVVSGWAPQATILGHPSTGAFLSHCGWRSFNESVYYGVPIIGMPMNSRMFMDAKMLVETGVCVEVVREENGVYEGEQIAKAINKVMVEKSSGEALRRRVKELSEKMRMEEKGAVGEAAEHLWQICCKNKGKD